LLINQREGGVECAEVLNPLGNDRGSGEVGIGEPLCADPEAQSEDLHQHAVFGDRELAADDQESRKWLKAREASHVSVVIFLPPSRKTPAHAGETSAPPSAIPLKKTRGTQLVRW